MAVEAGRLVERRLLSAIPSPVALVPAMFAMPGTATRRAARGSPATGRASRRPVVAAHRQARPRGRHAVAAGEQGRLGTHQIGGHVGGGAGAPCCGAASWLSRGEGLVDEGDAGQAVGRGEGGSRIDIVAGRPGGLPRSRRSMPLSAALFARRTFYPQARQIDVQVPGASAPAAGWDVDIVAVSLAWARSIRSRRPRSHRRAPARRG